MEHLNEPNNDQRYAMPNSSFLFHLTPYPVRSCSFVPSLVYNRTSRKPIEARGSGSEFPEFATFCLLRCLVILQRSTTFRSCICEFL
uniref:Uncharacterized protein n=1 Tax=Parascaris univalens TaxID=6257 RepID=A0A914ZY34_PARUN